MVHKTRKNYNIQKSNKYGSKHTYAKRGTQDKCKLKTCKSKMYQSIYGGTFNENIRSLRQLYF